MRRWESAHQRGKQKAKAVHDVHRRPTSEMDGDTQQQQQSQVHSTPTLQHQRMVKPVWTRAPRPGGAAEAPRVNGNERMRETGAIDKRT